EASCPWKCLRSGLPGLPPPSSHSPDEALSGWFVQSAIHARPCIAQKQTDARCRGTRNAECGGVDTSDRAQRREMHALELNGETRCQKPRPGALWDRIHVVTPECPSNCLDCGAGPGQCIPRFLRALYR